MTNATVTRRARALALILAIGAGVMAYIAAQLVLATGLPTTADGAWTTAVLIASAAACCWAATVALLARAQLAREVRFGGAGAPEGFQHGIDHGDRSTPPTRSAGAGRRLAVVLLTVAGWTVTSSAGAMATAPFTPAAPVAAAPSVPGMPGVPSPDFGADRLPAPTTDPSAPCRAPEPTWTPNAPKAIAPADASPLLMTCGGPQAGDPTPPVVVHRGDNLWTIVARTLGPDASAAQVAREVPRWHAANRDVIGTDPDLLIVGQVLHAPAAAPVEPAASPADSPAAQGGSR